MIEIDISDDIKTAERQLRRVERGVIPRAVNSTVNKTMTNTKTAINRYIAKETGLKIKADLEENQVIIRSNFHTLTATMRVRKREYNLRRFVTPARLKIGAFDKKGGVKASPWRRPWEYKGAFIMLSPYHDKLIVVKRSNLTRSGIKGMYGPSLRAEIQRPKAQRLIYDTVANRFKINFAKDLKFYLKRARR